MNVLRGHPIYHDGQQWRFVDTGEPTADAWGIRPCGHCGLHDTPEGHDACLGTLTGVMNACCGHGETEAAYVQFADGLTIHGAAACYAIERYLQSQIEQGV